MTEPGRRAEPHGDAVAARPPRGCGPSVRARAPGGANGPAGSGSHPSTYAAPAKIMISSRQGALPPAGPHGADQPAGVRSDPPIVDTLATLFEARWARATEPHSKEVSPAVLTQREKTLVSLLAQGHTDSSAARELGLSPRSITYTMRALMDRFGVENRFQLGLALGALRVTAIPGGRGDASDSSDNHY